MKKIIRWVLIVLILAAVGIGGYWYYRSHVVSAATTTSEQTYAQIVEVTQGNMAATASVVGQLEAAQSASPIATSLDRLIGAANKRGMNPLPVQTAKIIADICCEYQPKKRRTSRIRATAGGPLCSCAAHRTASGAYDAWLGLSNVGANQAACAI